jgi:hypothetical protein
MSYVLSILGIIGSFFLLKYREKAGDAIGDAEWMQKVGGVYNLMIFVSIFIFFWSISTLTGTTGFFFGWVKYIIPGANQQGVDPLFQ